MSPLCYTAGMALLCLASHAHAQPTSGAQAASAASVSTPSTPPNYRSAFDGYRAFVEQPVVGWRQSNDLVGRIGGWQAYAREGQGGPVAGTVPVPPAASGSMAGMPGMGGGTATPARDTTAKPEMQMPGAAPGKPMRMSPAASSPSRATPPVAVNPSIKSPAAQEPSQPAPAAMPGHKMP